MIRDVVPGQEALAAGFDGRELTLERDAPGFAQRGSAKLSDDGSTLAGVWQLNEDDQGYCDDLAFTYRRGSGPRATSRSPGPARSRFAAATRRSRPRRDIRGPANIVA
jgi:hypothetical protein